MFTLDEDITIWSFITDNHGVKTWFRHAAKGKHAFKQEKFTDINGNQQISASVCYSDDDNFKPEAYVFFGASADLEPPQAANDIKALSQTPSFGIIKKAWF